jgi:cytochrome c
LQNISDEMVVAAVFYPFILGVSAMSRIVIAIALAVASLSLLPLPARAQNADTGKQVFKQVCGICHDVAPDKNRVGPSLFGIVGRKTGSVAGFHYSDGNKNANLTWDEATLDRYLIDPRATVPGTTMAYAGMKDDQKRKDLIAYLATLH